MKEGLEAIGKGIMWAGFWIGLGLLGSDFIRWVLAGLGLP